MRLLLSFFLLVTISNSANSQSLCTYYLDLSHHYTYNRDYEKALFYANKALKRYPDSSRCYLERGGAYFFAKKLDEAYIDFEQYILLEPNDPDGYYWRGIILSESRVFNEAETDYLKCIELGSDSEYLRVKLAEAFLYQDKYDQAETNLLNLIENNPNSADAYNFLGLLFEKKSDYQKSIDYFTSGIEIDKDFSPFYYNRARVNMEIGNKDEACEDWTTALRLGADGSEIWLDANNCAGLNGLTDEDKEFDKKERLKSSKGKPNSIIITSDYLPLIDHARYTYTSEIEGEVDTAATAIRMDFETRTHYLFDLFFSSSPNIDLLYFEIMHSNEFKLNGDTLSVLQRTTELEKYPVHLFPQEFKLGKEHSIENTWNPKALYEAKSTAFSVEGIEPYELPNGAFVECVKLRVETTGNNGRNSLSYLWLVKGFGLVKWRNSSGEIWKLIRFAIPEYGSFPPEESKYLLPPQEDISPPTER